MLVAQASVPSCPRIWRTRLSSSSSIPASSAGISRKRKEPYPLTSSPLYAEFNELIVASRLVALIELAEGPLACANMIICIDRSIPKGGW